MYLKGKQKLNLVITITYVYVFIAKIIELLLHARSAYLELKQKAGGKKEEEEKAETSTTPILTALKIQ